jgi:hypothetical protein
MKVAISSGHGKYIRGASGYPCPPQLDEVDEARKVVETTASYLRSAGVDVQTWHDDWSDDQSENLNRIVAWHNDTAFGGGDHDYDVSVHFNSDDGSAHGTECLYVTQESLATKVAGAIATASGLTNRGAKFRDDLFVLNNTREKAIIVETCFCNNTNDSNIYRSQYQDICRALAEAISGRDIQEGVPPGEQPPAEHPPSTSGRPTISRGDSGYHVVTVQECLQAVPIDGDFGPITETAVKDYQGRHSLDVDGIVGPMTWGALEADYQLPPYPPVLPPALDEPMINAICEAAMSSKIARYSWPDRGVMPEGYVKGMALGYATVLKKYFLNDPAAVEMAKPNTWNSDTDVFAWYEDTCRGLGWGTHNEEGVDNLRHLWAILYSLGPRESSGKHCCGRDMSADNVQADTAEAGLFQSSWNLNTCSDTIQLVFEQYSHGTPLCALQYFSEGVSCSESDWSNYGSGPGYEHQVLSKTCPQYHAEMTAVGMRNRRQHWGPINRRELTTSAWADVDDMLRSVQDIAAPASA